MKPLIVQKGADLTDLAEIHASCFAEPWTVRALSGLLDSQGAVGFVTEGGFILARVAANEAEILTLAVRPECRRRGNADALVRAVALHARRLGAGRIFLEVAVSNSAAGGLYKGLGFLEVGRRKGYYAAGPNNREDALILRSNLPLSPLGKRPAAG